MKRNSLKKAVSVVLTGAILLGFAACDFGGASKKAVIEAADGLASDMASASAGKLIKNSTLDKKSSEAESLTALLDSGNYSEDQLAFFKAVEGTIEYEVDESSVKVEKDSASVDITFTMADYSSVLKDEYTDISKLTSAIKKADTKEVKFTAEFVQEDKEWIPDNVGSKKFMKLYDYRNCEIQLQLTAEMIASFIDRSMSEFWLASDGKYIDTTFIEYDYFFDSAVYEYADRGVYVYFKLLKDGSSIFESEDILFGESTNISCRVESADIGLSSYEAVSAGSYTIQLLTSDGDELIDSASVQVEVSPAVPSNPGGNGGNGGNGGAALSGEGVYFDFTDASFRNSVIDAGWYDYDDCLIGDYTYTSDVKTIAFSIEVTADCNRNVTYFYAWTDEESSEAIKDALDNPEFTNAVSPTSYQNGYFYDLDYTLNGAAKSGFYMLVVLDSTTGNVLMYGYCEVS